jgi:hypothetical protein
LIGVNALAQNDFKKGYFIYNNGEKVECLINNESWSFIPSKFQYKKSESSQNESINTTLIKEFSIPNVFKYERHTVKIDKSSKNESNLSRDRKPNYIEESLVLKVIVEGKTKLYQYNEEGLSRFFYTNEIGEIIQLIYKKYRTEKGYITFNELYKIQLKKLFSCGKSNYKKVAYSKRSLKNYFTSYNKCKYPNQSLVDYSKKESKAYFDFSLLLGVTSGNTQITDNSLSAFTTLEGELSAKTVPRFGVQVEYFIPFGNYKWSVFASPIYQSFSDQKTLTLGTVVVTSRTYAIEYSSIEMPIGIRRHFYFNNNTSEVFLNLAYVVDIPLNSKISSLPRVLEIESTGTSISAGLGYKLQKKYSLELRYSSPRNILSSFVSTDAKYESVSLIFGYTLF